MTLPERDHRPGSVRDRCHRPGGVSTRHCSERRPATHGNGAPCETINREACAYTYPAVPAIWRTCVLLLVSYVIVLYCGRFRPVWRSRYHCMIVSIVLARASHGMEEIRMLDVDYYVLVSDMSLLQASATRVQAWQALLIL